MKDTENQHPERISLLTATCLVVANMIGTGVFTSLGFQVVDIQSGFSLLFLWFVGGVFALCGALAYGELGAAMPRSGGEYHYLSKIYHPALGFLSGWLSVTVGFAAPIAAAAIALGTYFCRIIWEPENIPSFYPQAIALFVAIVISVLNTKDLKLASSFQQIFTLLKVLLIVVFIACGLLLATPQDISFLPSAADPNLIFSAPFAISMVYVTYSYSGWNAAIYLASDIDQPAKNLPRSLLLGTAIVMVLYLLLNLVFLYSTPIDQLAGQLEIGYISGNQIFGAIGAKIMAFLISFGLISSISSMVLAGPRVPYTAILFQLAIVVFFIITATFESVITYLGFTLTLSSFLTVLGVFVHRIRYPEVARPYKTWGYPVTPIIFLLISLWIMIFLLQGKPEESVAGLYTIALGLPVYFWAVKKKLAD
jgi:APA family basic amino acid/polyamine antiporter